MSYLVTGAKGQLGQEVSKLLKENGQNYTAYDAKELNILDQENLSRVFELDKPDFVFHCAAYTAVDQAEDNKEINWDVNVNGTNNIIEACKSISAKLIFISTDYVFDGTSISEYKENDLPNPQSEYGRAKLAAEQLIQAQLKDYYIIRTSWVFGEFGNNFVYTMNRLAKERKTLTVVSDQIGRPTWTRTLAEFMYYVTKKHPETGIYHLSNDDSCSWYEFAKDILKDQDVILEPILSEDYPQKADRPKHSVLSLEKVKKTGFYPDSWKVALDKFVNC